MWNSQNRYKLKIQIKSLIGLIREDEWEWLKTCEMSFFGSGCESQLLLGEQKGIPWVFTCTDIVVCDFHSLTI